MLYQEILVNGQWPQVLPEHLIEHRHQISNDRLFDFYGDQLNDYQLRNAPYYNKEGIWSKNCSYCNSNLSRESKFWCKSGTKDGMSADCRECRRKRNNEKQRIKLKDPIAREKQNLSSKRSTEKIVSKTKESEIVSELNSIYNGKTEVTNNYGRIDILTDSTIYEVKESRLWKAALGQVMAYAQDYPNHHLRIILYGKKIPRNYNNIVKACLYYNVEVEFLIRK